MNPTALLECVSSMSCIVTQLSTGLIVGALLFLVAAGLTPLQALQAATIVNAEMLKLDKETGALDAGLEGGQLPERDARGDIFHVGCDGRSREGKRHQQHEARHGTQAIHGAGERFCGRTCQNAREDHPMVSIDTAIPQNTGARLVAAMM